jgi:6-methylsalicylate decarboxylase
MARRTAPPRLRRDGLGWILELGGEPAAPFDPRDHDPAARDDADLILIAPSFPTGLPDGLREDFHAGILELGPPFELWAVLGDDIDELLDAGAIGAAVTGEDLVPSRALERLQARGAPLLVHPGPARTPPMAGWWASMTDYVSEMHAAWHSWAQWGRASYPSLTVVFAMLAGLAPLHAERLAARGGPSDAVHDRNTFFDTSSYGPRALDAMLRAVGVDRLVYGSDRPVVAPVDLGALGAAAEHAIAVVNPGRILGLEVNA